MVGKPPERCGETGSPPRFDLATRHRVIYSPVCLVSEEFLSINFQPRSRTHLLSAAVNTVENDPFKDPQERVQRGKYRFISAAEREEERAGESDD